MASPAASQSRARNQAQKAGLFNLPSLDDLGREGAKTVDHWVRVLSPSVAAPRPAQPRHYQTIRTVSPENRVMTSKDYARADARKRAAATPGVMRAFNNGASFNTIDEIDAFGASLETGLNNFGKRLGLTEGVPYSMREAYDAVHAAEAEATAAYARRRPIVSGVATGVGAAANPLNKVGVGWAARGGRLGNVAARSAVLGGLNGAASGAGEGSSLEERTANARNGSVFGAMAGGATPYVARGLGTVAQSVAKAASPRVQALADQLPRSVMRAYDDALRKGSEVFARGWPPRRPAVVDAVLDAAPLIPRIGMVGEGVLQSGPPRFTTPARSQFADMALAERRALIEDKLEANAMRRLMDMERARPGAHFVERHGPQTTLSSQYNRAAHGINPTTGVQSYPVNATRFLDARDPLNAITRAEQIYVNTGARDIAARPIGFGRVIGEGFERGSLNYGQQTKAVVKLDSRGKAYTAYPLYGH